MRIPGIAHRSDLPGLGITDATRRRLLRQGQMRRVGTWYVTDEAPEALVALLEQGVRPTCVTAAEQHDLGVPLHTGDHVYRPRGLVPGAPRLGPCEARLRDEDLAGPRPGRWPLRTPHGACPFATRRSSWSPR